jgi:predicted RNA-binding protein associated with RNAse of E/G family
MSDTPDLDPIVGETSNRERGVTVVKLNPAGQEVARYIAEVLDDALPETWFAVRATWTMKRVDVGGLVFEPGDTLVEYFSTEHWYNAFRIISPGGEVRGVYGNVTYPTTVTRSDGGTVVTWHDLYLDVLRLADGSVLLCDEDELAASGLERSDPGLHGRIRRTAAEMLELARTESFPFHTN